MPRRRLALVALVLPLAGCGTVDHQRSDDSGKPPSASSSPSASAAVVLPVGKADMTVGPGDVQSPEGFTPTLTVGLAGKWTSVHRDTDAFDLSQPDPKRDAPLVAVVIARPEGTGDAALAAIGRDARRAGARTTRGDLSIAGLSTPYLDLRNGSGQVFTSADGTIALDAAPKQRLRAIALQVSGSPVVVLVLVPDAAQWSSVWPRVRGLLPSIHAA